MVQIAASPSCHKALRASHNNISEIIILESQIQNMFLTNGASSATSDGLRPQASDWSILRILSSHWSDYWAQKAPETLWIIANWQNWQFLDLAVIILLAKTKKLITLVWVVSEIFKAPTAKREKYTSNWGLIFHELQIIRVDFKIFYRIRTN